MTISISIIAALLIMYAHQVWLNKSKPISATYFYIQLIASLALVCIVWFANSEGKLEFKILLTAVAAISMTQRFLSYNKARKTAAR